MPKYINADELLEQMKDRRFYVGRRSDPICIIEDTPAAEVEPVIRGKWIEYKHEGQIAQYCSECGSDPGVIYLYGRCPTCGAHMGGRK